MRTVTLSPLAWQREAERAQREAARLATVAPDAKRDRIRHERRAAECLRRAAWEA